MAERKRSVGGDTRRDVMTRLLKSGPSSAADIADALSLSPAGVRRHLDVLLEESLVETCRPNLVAGEEASRGRPAKHYRLTELGRSQFGEGYEDIAVGALEAVRELGGSEAVGAFARRRAESLLGQVDGVDAAQGGADGERGVREVEDVVRDVAAALEERGYAVTVTRAGGGVQICQHHCPISAAAAAHPELCEAEHEAISRLVGSHVQPLALIADGNGVCTTNIPLSPRAAPPQRPG